MKIGKFDAIIGQQIVLDATDEEIAAREAEITEYTATKQSLEIAATQLRNTKIAAYVKLGLTEAEIEALLPTPKAPRL